MTDQPIDKLHVKNIDPPDIVVRNLYNEGYEPSGVGRGLPLKKLQRLIEPGGEWGNVHTMRLLAWSEDHKSWFMWTEAGE